ncbi:ARM repeat-containing protein [Sistotremastrum suecicum HHB10207 ss-3]|uniref:ARM repeat-containing protein n=1 Tax=Sistotremastrum suecicum HHB10207 ss-3 TaxID=1314776 RepID=A0A166HNF3_9AGAM|nr:ARM repeat-containing protein [Sistotremastrum suecicum HHB10207 ss-3]
MVKPPTNGTDQPVPPDQILQALVDATSQDPALLKSSAERLKAYADHPGTWDVIYTAASYRDLALHVRQMAIIQFKNGAITRWRSRKYLSDDQRANIRTKALTFLDETDDIIADCNAVIVSKIARADYPTLWPTLIAQLSTVLSAQAQQRFATPVIDMANTLVLRRALKTLSLITKEFAAMKMLTGVRTMSKIISDLHPLMISQYSQFSTSFQSRFSLETLEDQQLLLDITLAHSIFKSLSHMMTWLWLKVDKAEFASMQQSLLDFFQGCVNQVTTIVGARLLVLKALKDTGSAPSQAAAQCLNMLNKHILAFGKMFRKWQKTSSSRFVKLPSCSQLVLYYWGLVEQAANGTGEDIDVLFPVRLLVQAMSIFKESLKEWSPIRKTNAEQIGEVLSQDFVEKSVTLLITRFIPLTPVDLEKWSEDPEEWNNEEDKDADSYEYELRPCSERVLLTLTVQYRHFAVPLILAAFNQVKGTTANDLQGIVQKETMYCVVGRCASRLRGEIDFESWLRDQLVPEAQQSDPNYRVLKRRISWTVGRWVAEGGSTTTQVSSTTWELLTHLLCDRGTGSDTIVRLAAAVAIREVVDAVDFKFDTFAPFLRPVVEGLLQIIEEVDTLQSKRKASDSLNVVITQAKLHIVPFMHLIAQRLPALWTEADTQGDYLFKASILTTMTQLVNATQESSSSLTSVVVSFITEAMSPNNRVQLDNEGFQLWTAAVRNSTSLAPAHGERGLFDLFPECIVILSENLDVLGSALGIAEAYILLDPSLVLGRYCHELFSAYVSAISKIATANIKEIILSLNLIVQLAPSTLWAQAMHTSGLFALMVQNIIEDHQSPDLITHYLFVFARIVLQDPSTFLQLISATAALKNVAEEIIFNGLLDQWRGKYDNIAEIRNCKLSALGLASLVGTGHPVVLDRLGTDIFDLWMECFGILEESLPPSTQMDKPLILHWQVDGVSDPELRHSDGTLEEQRRRQLASRDPVQTTKLTAFIAAKLQEAQAVCGGPDVFQAKFLGKVNADVIRDLQAELAK